MKIGYIVPFEHLNLSSKGGIIFSLIKETLENDSYKQFIRQQLNTGMEVYLDANIHERERDQIDFDKAMEIIINEKLCSVIIIPDHMFLMEQTLSEVNLFLNKWYKKCKQTNIEIMAVCQGRNIEELYKCFIKLNSNKKIDRIGVPFDNSFINIDKNSYINQAFSRIYFLQKISRLSITKKIHCLGCNSVLEVKMASLFPFVYSLDTKLFTRIAMAEIQLTNNNWVYVTKPKHKMLFTTKLTDRQQLVFEHNIMFMKWLLI